jgi:hypothetical protein
VEYCILGGHVWTHDLIKLMRKRAYPVHRPRVGDQDWSASLISVLGHQLHMYFEQLLTNVGISR